MGLNEGAVRRLAAGPHFSRRQPRQNVWGIIVQLGSVAEVLRPKITLIVFWPTQGRVDNHCVINWGSSLDNVLCNCIVIVASESAVIDILTP